MYETDMLNNFYQRNLATGARTPIGVIVALGEIRGLAVFQDVVTLE